MANEGHIIGHFELLHTSARRREDRPQGHPFEHDLATYGKGPHLADDFARAQRLITRGIEDREQLPVDRFSVAELVASRFDIIGDGR